jgi:7-cyano-7-deazaguanine synthase
MRNAIFPCHAFGIAAAKGLNVVAAGTPGSDHCIYPDCRPAFVGAFAAMQRLALERVAQIALEAPFLTWRKADIVGLGRRLGVPFAETWSCYKARQHCGRCGTCVARRETFHIAGVKDPTAYDEPDYWLETRRGHLCNRSDREVGWCQFATT